jgi:hypothetical protein
MRLEVLGAVDHVLAQLRLIEARLHRAPVVVVAGIPSDRREPVRGEREKASTAARRATSSMYGLSPRFSCTTSTLGNGPSLPAGCTRYPRISPELPPGEG